MNQSQRIVLTILVASLYSLGALAQTDVPSGNVVGSNDQHQVSDKAAAKAEHKRKRKELRAKKNAELKKLERNGYRPSQSGPGYPENLQKAQKRSESNDTPEK